GERAEDGRECRDHALGDQRLLELLVERHHDRDRQVRIHLPDRCADAGHYRRGVAVSPDIDNAEVAIEIDLFRNLVTQTLVARVGGHTYDFDVGNGGRVGALANPVADRESIREVLLSERLIDDAHLRTFDVILLSERTPLEDGNAHRLEVAIADVIHVRVGDFLAGLAWTVV